MPNITCLNATALMWIIIFPLFSHVIRMRANRWKNYLNNTVLMRNICEEQNKRVLYPHASFSIALKCDLCFFFYFIFLKRRRNVYRLSHRQHNNISLTQIVTLAFNKTQVVVYNKETIVCNLILTLYRNSIMFINMSNNFHK